MNKFNVDGYSLGSRGPWWSYSETAELLVELVDREFDVLVKVEDVSELTFDFHRRSARQWSVLPHPTNAREAYISSLVRNTSQGCEQVCP